MGVTSVTLGSFYTNSNGVAVLGGAGGSGLDTQSLIKNLVTAKSTGVTADQTQITTITAQSSALTSFNSLLSTFKQASDALRSPPGINSSGTDAFKLTTGSVGNGGSSYVSVTTQAGAALQSYNISNITSLATAANQSTGTFVLASADADATVNNGGSYFGAGNITFNGATIAINSGDSLNTIAASFNAVQNTTGVAASVVSIDSTHYQLSFTATKTGTNGNFDLNNATADAGVLTNAGLVGSDFATTHSFIVLSADSDATAYNGGANFNPGTIHFNGADITINQGDSLNTIKAAFNAVSGTTGVTATVDPIDGTHYQLLFTASSNFDLIGATDASGVLTNLGLSSGTQSQGTNAQFQLNGISISRQSNSVSDVINNVTFNILQTTPNAVTNYPVTIAPDTTTIQNSIVTWVNAYNAIKTFATQQTQLNSDGTYASTAVLANDTTFRQTIDNINAQVVSQVAGIAANTPNNLSDIGITLTNQAATNTTPEVDNILTVNSGQLTTALASNFQGVKNLFGFNLTSSNPNLAIYSHSKPLAANAFTLTATIHAGPPDTSSFVATFAGGTGLSPVTLTATALAGSSGYSLVGPTGSSLDGVQLIYAATSNATISVTATQGIADQTFNSTNTATTANTGTIAVALKALQTSQTSLNDDITRQNKLISQYQTQITAKFSALEQAIASTNTLLQSLNANANAQLTASGH